MPTTDIYGAEHSTDNANSIERYQEAVNLLLGFFNDPVEVIDQALAEDPGFVMGHCFKAGLLTTFTEKSVEPDLIASLKSAEALAGNANERERMHMTAARAWAEGDFTRSGRLYGEITLAYPRDIFAVQMSHLGCFYLGQSRWLRDRIAQVLPEWREGDPGYGYLLGMHAFGLEEMNEFARAEEAGRKAVAHFKGDAWAVHAVAHAMEMQGRTDDGISWMETQAKNWSPNNFFAYHNWWHTALYHLDRGDHARVLEIYDSGVRAAPSEAALELVDASALLGRMHLEGADVGERWTEVADNWQGPSGDGYYAFNDFHAVLACVATGRTAEAEALIASLEAAAGADGTNAMMAREVGLPASRAIHAFGQGDYAETVERLAGLRLGANRFGGSNAQRDVIDWTLVEAAIRAGDGPHARAFVNERLDRRPDSPTVRAHARRASAIGTATAAAAE
ncbi:MAG TPA: tetratricopeptide repeat protein [Alphaproteobacteria bacterium]|nr:tetratricopeptide repeat protein [Alphaproteobacteria bacterium]